MATVMDETLFCCPLFAFSLTPTANQHSPFSLESFFTSLASPHLSHHVTSPAILALRGTSPDRQGFPFSLKKPRLILDSATAPLPGASYHGFASLVAPSYPLPYILLPFSFLFISFYPISLYFSISLFINLSSITISLL
jgi:hypothetical protein